MGYEADHERQAEKSYRERTMSVIQSKNLCSMMNNTKWIELKKGIAELPFPPPYVFKAICEEEKPLHRFDEDVSYWGDWGLEEPYLSKYLSSDMHATPFYAVEWVKVRPRYKKHRGQLIADEIIDETTEFVSILEKYNIPYEEFNGAYIIYGYRS